MTQGRVELGNGQEEQFDVYAATVIWDGQPRRILVDAADTMPLVGMSLMYGYNLLIEILDGGSVTLRSPVIVSVPSALNSRVTVTALPKTLGVVCHFPTIGFTF